MGSEDSSAGARYLRKLSHGVAGARTGAVEAATQEALSPVHAEEALELTIRTIERETGSRLDRGLRTAVETLFLEDGRRAIERLKREGVDARFHPREEDALEAIVELDGSRPTIAVLEDDRIDPEDEALREWREVVRKFAAQISVTASAVGRVDLDGRHKGTAFVVAEGLVLTNRHVLQEVASQRRNGDWTFRGQPTLTFDSSPDASRQRQFRIERVVLAGPDVINPLKIDHDKLDFAVLACELSGAPQFPAALPLESDADKVVEGRPIFAVGYSGQAPKGTYHDDVLARLFQHRYGVKRFAPGEIDGGLASAAAGTGDTVFSHDATTLGGNSGSCVVDMGNDGRLVVGVHFAGVPKRANYAHSNARLRASFVDLELSWKDWIDPRSR